MYAYRNLYKCGCVKTPRRIFCASIALFCSCACVCVCVYVCAYVQIHVGAETFICMWVRICNYIQLYMWCVHVDFFFFLFVYKGIWDMCMSKLLSRQVYSKSTQEMWREFITTYCTNLQQPATHCNTLQHTATHCNTRRLTATHCNTLQHTATHGNSRQHTATHCNALQHTATHCNTLQHTFVILHSVLQFSTYNSQKSGIRRLL